MVLDTQENIAWNSDDDASSHRNSSSITTNANAISSREHIWMPLVSAEIAQNGKREWDYRLSVSHLNITRAWLAIIILIIGRITVVTMHNVLEVDGMDNKQTKNERKNTP